MQTNRDTFNFKRVPSQKTVKQNRVYHASADNLKDRDTDFKRSTYLRNSIYNSMSDSDGSSTMTQPVSIHVLLDSILL